MTGKTALRAVVERSWIEVVADSDPDVSYLDQAGWEERLAAYDNGEFGFVGVRACAELVFKNTDGAGGFSLAVVRSPGLWGIEDDSGEEYLREVGKDECGTLADMLQALAIVTDADTLYRNADLRYA